MSSHPRLAGHVAARRHIVGGEAIIILHDSRAERVAKIGEREWLLLRCADGTRDLDGIRAAAAAEGRGTKREHVETFFAELGRAGMLSDGVGQLPELPTRPAPDRPLVPLPNFRLHCDGSGSCCRLYPTTAFSPIEVSHARVHAPAVLDCGLDPMGVFTPETGSVSPPWRSQSVTMVDGRCAFLSAGQHCVLQEAGGVQAKPQGCRHFPTTFVDDGETLRVSVAPECACVFRSALQPAPGGTALVSPAMTSAGDLDPSVFVSQLADRICLTPSWSVPCATLVALGGALDRGLQDVDADCDAARLLWILAEQLEQGDCDPTRLDVAALIGVAMAGSRTARAPDHDELAALAGELSTVLDRRINQDADWRAEADLGRQVPRRMRGALTAVARHGWRLDACQRSAERFYLRAILHGHLWLTGNDGSLCESLRGRALRLLIARAITASTRTTQRAAEPALDYPLALVEAVSRGFGLVHSEHWP